MRAGAVVLAGGRSSRMGRAKALLDWHGTSAVHQAVEVVREGISPGPVCVVRASGQELPPLEARVVDDTVAHGGPLAGLHRGLESLGGEAEVAFACGVDTPLLVPAFVRAVLGCLRDDDDAVVPLLDGRPQPLLAAYRVEIAPLLAALLERGALGLRDIPSACRVRSLAAAELLRDEALAATDPGLRSAANANTPAEWDALVAESLSRG